MPVNKFIPQKSSAIYHAAALIIRCGPHQLIELYTSIDFGPAKNRQVKLDHAFDIDWLRPTPDGRLDVTEKARQYFADQEPKERYIGQTTPAPNWNVYERPALSKKNIPNSRGTRQDIPEWSVRSPGFGMKSVPGGGV
jgi:hypothetical protein